jgi:hypothetical protein
MFDYTQVRALPRPLKLQIMSKHAWNTTGYNGWSNYATFRVHNDILNGYQWDEGEDIYVDLLKAIVENAVFENSGAVGLIVDYANLFLNNVDWNELVETYNYDRQAK